jgi:hypothetical protein
MAAKTAISLILYLTAAVTIAMANNIHDVKKRHEQEFLQKPGVVSVGIGLDDNVNPAIVIGLERITETTTADFPKQLEGYNVVLREVGSVKTQ